MESESGALKAAVNLKLIKSVAIRVYHLTEMLWGLNGIIHL